MNDFITSLYGDCTQGVFNLWTKQDKRTHSFDIADKNSIINKINDLKDNYDVYYEVCLQKDFPPQGKRGKSDTALVMPGLWFDLDIAGSNHAEEKLPNQMEALMFIGNIQLQPTMIVSSGGGYHLYFLFREPLVFTSDDDREQAKELSKRFQQYIKKLAQLWKLDSTHDLARLLRVPYTLNLKQGQRKEVTIEDYGNRYSPDEIASILDKLESEEEKTTISSKLQEENDQSKHPVDLPPGNLEAIRRECAWMNHCRVDARILSEPEWFAMLSIIGRCVGAKTFAHLWSESYPGYSPEETDKKLAHASGGPRTCKSIREDLTGEEYCSECIHCGKILSPIALGNSEPSPDFSKQFTLNERGNAKRLVYLYGNNLRHAIHRNRWLVWNGRIWNPDVSREIYRKAEDTIDSMLIDLSENSDHIRKHVNMSGSRKGINNMISLASTQLGIPISPDKLDNRDMLLTCRNGTIDLKKGELRAFKRSDYITKMIPVTYDAEAKCPMFLKFIGEVLSKELVDFMQRAIGYTLTGKTTEQCFFFLHGGGANGKSTLLEVIRELMGDYSRQTNIETFLKQHGDSIREDLARLRGSRFVTASETEDGRKLSEVLIKQITGGEPIAARFMRQNSFEFYPKFKIFMSSNYMPIISGTDEGIWRRIHLIPFNVWIPEERRDLDLNEKLVKELPGILNWAIEGCLKWQSEGLNPPDIVKQATAAYRSSQDVIGKYLSERILPQSGGRINKPDLFSDYETWCEANCEIPATNKALSNSLKKRGYAEGKSGNRYWKDVVFTKGFTVSA